MSFTTLTALIRRCGQPIFATTDDVALAATALIAMAPYMDPSQSRDALVPLRKFAKHRPSLLAAALEESVVDPKADAGGRHLVLAACALPSSPAKEMQLLWGKVSAATTRALEAAIWPCADLYTLLTQLRRAHEWDDAALVPRITAYLRTVVPTATAAELPALASLVVASPDLPADGEGTFLGSIATRCAAVAENLSTGAIGHLCEQLHRAGCVDPATVVAFQEEAGRCAESGDAYTAVHLFCFIASHPAPYISTDALNWLVERLSSEELDVDSVQALCVAVAQLPSATRAAMRQVLTDFVAALGAKTRELLEHVSVEQGGLSGSTDCEAIRSFAVNLLSLAAVLKELGDPATTLPADFLGAADACVGAVVRVQEDLLSAEESPVELLLRILEVPTESCSTAGLGLLKEAASQHQSFATIQLFRLLLALGDRQVVINDATVLDYLRDQFAKTAAGIPPVQLSVVLRCFVVYAGPNIAATSAADASDDAAERSRERLEEFLGFCVEKTREHLAHGAPLHSVLVTTECLHRLGCRDTTFFSDVAVYVDRKYGIATVEGESADTAVAVQAVLGNAILAPYPEVQAYLHAVGERGLRGESALSPSAWMHQHDPSSLLEPLTAEQQESWDLVEQMVHTRADDAVTLRRLAEKYIVLLPHSRPDDHKYFFGVFEEKVLKEDKLLKQCLDAIVESGKVGRLAASTIAGILHSLAAVRFQYFASVKQLMAGITTEQWLSMDAAPLVQILVAMEKLSLRSPGLLQHVGSRLDELCRFLTPMDTALAIHALQALGHNDRALLLKLTAHAAVSARRFDEASMTVLFTTPSVHRLLSTAEVARPLLLQASSKIHSQHRREKIAQWVQRSGLPRELIESATARLQVTSEAGRRAAATLRLT